MATAALLRDPRAVKLSNQLRAQAAALAARGMTSIAPQYIDEVADLLVSQGIGDLREITGSTTVEYGPNPAQLSMIGTEGESQIVYGNYPITRLFVRGDEWPITIGERATWYHDGRGDSFPMGMTNDGRFYVVVQWLEPPGAPLVLLIPFIERDTWRNLAIVAGFILPWTGLPALIGQAVLGAELAASYPLLANAVGTAATRTVLTGGDVESAVRGAAAGLVGAEFGEFAEAAVDSAAIGAAASAATTAVLQGDDPRQAALQAFVTKGATSMLGQSDFEPPEPPEFDPDEYLYLPPGTDFTMPVELGDITIDDLGLSVDLDDILGSIETPEALTIPVDSILPDDQGNLFAVDGHFLELSPEQYLASIWADDQGNIRAPDNNVLMPADEVIKYLETPAELAQALQSKIEPLQGLAVGSLELPNIPTLRPATLPPPASQTKTPIIDWAKTADQLLKTAVSIGGSIKAIATGNYRPAYPTSPFGTVRNTPVGVPVRQADGSTVVNNGNGTQTVRYADGRVMTVPSTFTSTGPAGNYGGSLIPGVPNTALLIGGGLVIAALLLSRR